MAPHAPTGAQGIGNPFAGLWSGAREVLRTLSYYEMKNRAGVVGQNGLGPLLAGLTGPSGAPRIHLMGHSFGARLVSYALAGLPADQTGAASPVKSLTLIQGAFSHFTFAAVAAVRPVPSGRAGRRRQPGRRAAAGHLQQPPTARSDGGIRRPACSPARTANPPPTWSIGGVRMGHDGYQQNPDSDRGRAARRRERRTTSNPARSTTWTPTRSSAPTSPPFSGAHSDIRHPEVLWAVVSAAGLTS